MLRFKIKRAHSRKEKDADSNKDVEVRAVTVDTLVSQLQTALTVSTLLIGISLTLMSATDRSTAISQRQVFAKHAPEDEYITSKIYQQASLLAGMFMFFSAGIEFFMCIWMTFSLDRAEIHPEDYDSAEDWRDSFIFFLYFNKGCEVVSYFCGLMSTYWFCFVEVNPVTLDVLYTFAVLAACVFFPLLPYLYFCHRTSSKKLYDRRKQDYGQVALRRGQGTNKEDEELSPVQPIQTPEEIINDVISRALSVASDNAELEQEVDPTIVTDYTQRLLNEKISTIALLKLMHGEDFKALGIPLGDAFRIMLFATRAE